MIRRSTAS